MVTFIEKFVINFKKVLRLFARSTSIIICIIKSHSPSNIDKYLSNKDEESPPKSFRVQKRETEIHQKV